MKRNYKKERTKQIGNIGVWNYDQLHIIATGGKVETSLEEVRSLIPSTNEIEKGRILQQGNGKSFALFYTQQPIIYLSLFQYPDTASAIVGKTLNERKGIGAVKSLLEKTDIQMQNRIVTFDADLKKDEKRRYDSYKILARDSGTSLQDMFAGMLYSTFLEKDQGMLPQEAVRRAVQKYNVNIPLAYI